MSERSGMKSQGLDTKSKGRTQSPKVGLKAQRLDSKPKGWTQSPKVAGQIPKACASGRRPDTKGFGTQLGWSGIGGGCLEWDRE